MCVAVEQSRVHNTRAKPWGVPQRHPRQVLPITAGKPRDSSLNQSSPFRHLPRNILQVVKQTKQMGNAICDESDNSITHKARVTSNVYMVIYLNLVNYWVSYFCMQVSQRISRSPFQALLAKYARLRYHTKNAIRSHTVDNVVGYRYGVFAGRHTSRLPTFGRLPVT